LGGVLDDHDDTEGSVLFQTNIIGRVLGHLRNIGNQPWLGSGTLLCPSLLVFFLSWVNEYLGVNINEFEDFGVSEFFLVVSNWFSIALDDVQSWEALHFVVLN
jgi:hypothetical protein